MDHNATVRYLNLTMGWEEMWASGLGRGDKFDAAAVEPALRDLIDSGALPPSGPALVPGCGRGYAVAALAESGGRDVLGIDIAPSAVKAAQERDIVTEF